MEIDVTVSLDNIDANRLLATWQWRLPAIRSVVIISTLGDAFLLGADDAVYWLQTDSGDVTVAADSLQEFSTFLKQEEIVDDWFLPGLVQKLVLAGKILQKGEVYTFTTLPVLGGAYSPENINPGNLYEHFTVTGQICQQIAELPDGTKVSVKSKRDN